MILGHHCQKYMSNFHFHDSSYIDLLIQFLTKLGQKHIAQHRFRHVTNKQIEFDSLLEQFHYHFHHDIQHQCRFDL